MKDRRKDRDDLQQVVTYKEQENNFPAAVLVREEEIDFGGREKTGEEKKGANSSDTNSGPKKGEEQELHCPERVENQSCRGRGGV